MGARFKTRNIKANKTYQVDELADAAQVSPQTIRTWLKAGMSRLDGERPTLIMGFQALEYLETRKAQAKQPLALGQFYCMRCKVPKAALGGMADYVATSTTGGRLKALCDGCEALCCRNISAQDLPEIRKFMAIEIKGMSTP